MNVSQMVYEMCHDVLSPQDIKAICKSRGFSEREATSRSAFENAFLSSVGVEDALSALTEAEVAALHLLRMEDRLVDVSFFERLYGAKAATHRAYGTFTQQFRPIFDAVQRNLVRKGVLVIAAAKTNSPTKTKMELWRYRFPPNFGPFLPPLVRPAIRDGREGELQADPLRSALRRLAAGGPAGPGPQRPAPIALGAGGLSIGTRPFGMEAVREWRQAAWQADIIKAASKGDRLRQIYQPTAMYTGYLLPAAEYRAETPLPAVLYAFAGLGPAEWIAPEALDTLLDVAYAGSAHPSSATICQTGWDNGLLARLRTDGQDYYRVAGAGRTGADDAPETYLPVVDGRVAVDAEKVPYESLELLNRIADFDVGDGRLRPVPNVVKLVDAADLTRNHALARYLRANDAEFRAAFKRIDAQWGKLIVHENLLVARVADVSLRVKLQQTFGDADGAPSPGLVPLAGEYVAFPRALLGDIEKFLKKAGHVVKTVQAT